MKKIPSLFQRDSANPKILTTEYHLAAAWVINGEGIATRKWDGTAVRILDGVLYARYDAKHGKPLPPDFTSCGDPDPITGHHPGWVPATRPQDRWIREAAGDLARWRNGWTFEAIGPKIGNNPEGRTEHTLIEHGASDLGAVPRTHAGLIAYFSAVDLEGVVWWRNVADPDCDKIKITGAALGVPRRRV
jgi:hypothetical protein